MFRLDVRTLGGYYLVSCSVYYFKPSKMDMYPKHVHQMLQHQHANVSVIKFMNEKQTNPKSKSEGKPKIPMMLHLLLNFGSFGVRFESIDILEATRSLKVDEYIVQPNMYCQIFCNNYNVLIAFTCGIVPINICTQLSHEVKSLNLLPLCDDFTTLIIKSIQNHQLLVFLLILFICRSRQYLAIHKTLIKTKNYPGIYCSC